MSARRTTATALLLMVAVVSCWQTPSAWGFAYWSQDTDPTGFTHILNNPNDYPSWDLTNITYKFDTGFTTDSRIRDQVRLAFDQWDVADATVDGASYSYNRANGWRDFVDIRSVATHEIGHVLGIHHPDQAAPVNRNWRPSGGTYVQQADNGDELMRSWINEGDYNHVLSHDELDAFDYAYGHDISFSEVTGPGSANITIGTYSTGSNIWAHGGWSGNWRNAGDHSQGIQITSGMVEFNTNASSPLGLQTLAINWDYQNTAGLDTAGLEVRTTGTNNPDVMWHFDGYSPASSNNVFNSFTTTSVSTNAKDDLLHVWGDPHVNGVSGPFPASDVIHVGLKQDVWDWSVVSAQVVDTDGNKTNAPLLGIHGPWNDTITGVTATATSSMDDIQEGLVDGGPERIGARGVQIVNTDVPSTLFQLALADVTGLGLDLDDLNARRIEELKLRPIPIELPNGAMTLDNDEAIYLILNGIPTEKGRSIMVDHPALLGSELMVIAETKTNDAIVGTYALVGNVPTTLIPEPTTIVLALIGLAGLLGATRNCRRP